MQIVGFMCESHGGLMDWCETVVADGRSSRLYLGKNEFPDYLWLHKGKPRILGMVYSSNKKTNQIMHNQDLLIFEFMIGKNILFKGGHILW